MRYHFADCVLDTERRELRRGEDLVAVAPQVFDLLSYLIHNRERILSKDDLIAAVWGGRSVSDSALTTRLNVARRSIGDSGEDQRLIKTLPRKGFRFVGAVREAPEPATAAAAESSKEAPRGVLSLPDKPSIAVLPFTNLGSDREQEYFADGIVGDIITELSRFSELFVIARNSSFQYKGKAVDVRQVGRELGVRYVLEGSVRRGRDRLRISAQLIDATTGVHRWAEHFDRKLADVFTVQDEVVRTIVAILAAHVRKAETERAHAKPPNNWQAYDYYLQAADVLLSFNTSFDVEDLHETRRLLQQSLAIDATYARSYAILAQTHTASWWLDPLEKDFLNPAALDQAHQFARKAVQLDSNLPQAHSSLGFALAWKGEHGASMAAFERAIALNPNYLDWRFGWALVQGGNSRRAIDFLKGYRRLDPFYPPLASGILGLAHYLRKQYSDALPNLRDCVSRAPMHRGAHAWLAAIYAQLGQIEDARAEAATVLRLQANYTITGTATALQSLKSANDAKHYFEGLRKAGLPE